MLYLQRLIHHLSLFGNDYRIKKIKKRKENRQQFKSRKNNIWIIKDVKKLVKIHNYLPINPLITSTTREGWGTLRNSILGSVPAV